MVLPDASSSPVDAALHFTVHLLQQVVPDQSQRLGEFVGAYTSIPLGVALYPELPTVKGVGAVFGRSIALWDFDVAHSGTSEPLKLIDPSFLLDEEIAFAIHDVRHCYLPRPKGSSLENTE